LLYIGSFHPIREGGILTKKGLTFKVICEQVKGFEVIFIGGCSRSGKSTLCQNLKSELNNEGHIVQSLSLDHWILDYRHRKNDMSVYDRFQWSKLQDDLKQILKRKSIVLPGYDASSREVKKSKELSFEWKGNILLIEGVIALALVDLAKEKNIGIYVDLPDDERKNQLFQFYHEYKGLDKRITEELIEKREKEEVQEIKLLKKNANIKYTINKLDGILF
jgi:uridine kinase